MKKADFVSEVVAMAQRVAGVEPQVAARLAAELRSSYGGQSVRILPREPVTLEAIDTQLRRGKPVRAIAIEMGVSRATLYRHLGAKVAKRRGNETG